MSYSQTQTDSVVKNQEAVWWLFRMFIMWEFVGHGAFGVITKPEWVQFFAVVGINETWAYHLMPIVGSFDILMGLSVLFYPTRAVLLWMAIWGVWTALLRPLSGTSWTEFFERAYNYGYPFACLYLAGYGQNLKHWFAKIEHTSFNKDQIKFIRVFFQVSIAAYLIGHGGFGLLDNKGGLVKQYDTIGITALFGGDVTLALRSLGAIEVLLGVAVLLIPVTPVLILICAWKVITELFFPMSGAFWGWFEFIERGSSYAMPIALIYFNKISAEISKK